MTKWYAMLDSEEVAYVGEYESIEDAFDAADNLARSVVWVFREDGLRALMDSAGKALIAPRPHAAGWVPPKRQDGAAKGEPS